MIRPASIYALFITMYLAEPALAQKTKGSKEIDVTATEFAFLPLPTRIAAGPTIFAFANQGKVPHELAIARLKPGATMDDFVKAGQDVARRRELFERTVGILIAGPGNRPDGRLLVDLVKGSTYVVFCNLRDKPDAPGHLMFGMYTTFTPK